MSPSGLQIQYIESMFRDDPNPLELRFVDCAMASEGRIQAKATDFIMQLTPACGEQNPEPSTRPQMHVKPMEADAYLQARVTECVKALLTGTIKQQRQAAGALALRDANDILPARERLIALLDNPEVLVVAMRALAKLGTEAAPAIPALCRILASKDVLLRAAVIYTLAQLGPAAGPALIEHAHGSDPDGNIREHTQEAVDALKKLP